MKFQDLPDPTYDNQPARISAVADLDWYREQHDEALAREDRINDYHDNTPVREALEEAQSEAKGTGPREQAGSVPVPSAPRALEGVKPAASLRASVSEIRGIHRTPDTGTDGPSLASPIRDVTPSWRGPGSLSEPRPAQPFFDGPEAA